MPDAPAKGPPAKGGKGAGLKRKVGPLPLWAWALIAAGAGWYLWRKLGSGQAAQATTQAGGSSGSTDQGNVPTAGTSGDTSGAGVSGITADQLTSALGAQQAGIESALQQSDQTQQQTMSDALAQLEAWLAGGGASGASTGGGGTGDGGGSGGGTGDGGGSGSTTTSQQPGGSNAPMWHPVAASTPNFAAKAAAQSDALRAQGAAVPFGGVVSVRKLANGATLTTYASGHQVEQAPGKTAYVVRK
jgi:hypothetical protein